MKPLQLPSYTLIGTMVIELREFNDEEEKEHHGQNYFLYGQKVIEHFARQRKLRNSDSKRGIIGVSAHALLLVWCRVTGYACVAGRPAWVDDDRLTF